MVKVDCATLPSALVENELFGREKGAYTGALSKQAGRFEVADGSTIFLDEIGELSLQLQTKLLRVLQDGEFERLGSPRTIKVNVRVIAATNHDLKEAIRNRTFREDLFYRLNVFPIRVPTLRERRTDIPMLVSSFLNEFNTKMRKNILRIPSQTMESLLNYSWPGNIRELRNVIEHAAIVSNDDTLRIQLGKDTPAGPKPHTLDQVQAEHIVEILKRTQWRIKGPNGAARILGMNPSTLYTRMKKLGIRSGEKDAIRLKGLKAAIPQLGGHLSR